MAETMTDFAAEREAMVERQLRRRGITEQHILDAFREVPREEFVGPNYAHLAYGDHPLPIEAGQTISQPYIVGADDPGGGRSSRATRCSRSAPARAMRPR